MADGSHIKEKKFVGSYLGLMSRAIILLIKDRLNITVKDLMEHAITDKGVEAGILNPDGTVRDDMKEVVDGIVELIKVYDNERAGTHTSKGKSK